MSVSSKLSKDEIYKNAKDFSETHKNDCYEDGQAQTFLNEFFNIFGIDRKKVAKFEEHPPNSSKQMDLFWPKILLVGSLERMISNPLFLRLSKRRLA